MNIDREYLDATLANLRMQHQEAQAMFERTRGAILLVEALVARLEASEPPEPKGGVA